jgi:molybdopterin-guanine dinucleotide biosynthesis protein A
MGGQPKGLLPVPGSGEPLVVHALRVSADAGYAACWLVGDLPAYDDVVSGQALVGYRGRLGDDPAGVGPLGGLRALLMAGAQRGLEQVVAIACDMPFVTAPLLGALRTHASDAAVVAARRDPSAPWEPLLARYRPSAVLPALDAALSAGTRSFQALLATVEVVRFEADGVTRALDDWDRPEDVRSE